MKQKDRCNSVNLTDIELKFGVTVAKVCAKQKLQEITQNFTLNCATLFSGFDQNGDYFTASLQGIRGLSFF